MFVGIAERYFLKKKNANGQKKNKWKMWKTSEKSTKKQKNKSQVEEVKHEQSSIWEKVFQGHKHHEAWNLNKIE